MPYSIVIDSIDRTADIIARSVTVDDVANDQVNSCNLSLIDLSGNGIPEINDEIIITLDSGEKLFAGNILTVNYSKARYGSVSVDIRCVDYTRELDRRLAHISYEGQTDEDIIDNLIATYCAGTGITTTNVTGGVTIDQIVFNYKQLSQVLRQLAGLTGKNWYIDYDKDIHFFPLTTNAAPFNITDSSTNYSRLNIKKDASKIKNRVYVRGGTKLSDFTTYTEKGDGEKRQFILPDKPHDVTVEVNSVSKTVGIKNIDTSGFDWYVNFQEKYIEQDSGATVLSTSDTLEVTYKYDIPILVAQEDSESIELYGVHEFPIFDTQIATTDAARDRAIAELTDYANSIVDGSFVTRETGFHSGQYININLTNYEINDDYLIQRVRSRSLGAGYFEHEISIASSKTMGIIRLLINMLENNRNLINLDPNEVVDELFSITDALLSDSLTDMITDSVSTPPFKWSNDAGTTPNKMRWDLFEWG